MNYLDVKAVHIIAVSISIVLFVLRFFLSLRSTAWRQYALLRIGPHINDTVLLATAVWLCIASRRYPIADGWLTAKVVALLLYIVAGSVAIRHGRSVPIRAAAFLFSVACISYIVGAALHHSPWSWLAPALPAITAAMR